MGHHLQQCLLRLAVSLTGDLSAHFSKSKEIRVEIVRSKGPKNAVCLSFPSPFSLTALRGMHKTQTHSSTGAFLPQAAFGCPCCSPSAPPVPAALQSWKLTPGRKSFLLDFRAHNCALVTRNLRCPHSHLATQMHQQFVLQWEVRREMFSLRI